MKLETVKKALEIISKKSLEFKVKDVELSSKTESDYETPDSISRHEIEEFKAKLVLNQPGYDDFGFKLEKTRIEETLVYGNVDENGVDYENGECSDSKVSKYYNSDIFSDTVPLSEDVVDFSYELLNGENSMLSDIPFEEGKSLSLDSYTICFLDEPLNNYLKKEHKITLDSFVEISRKVERLDDSELSQIMSGDFESIAKDLYKDIRSKENESPKEMVFDLMGS